MNEEQLILELEKAGCVKFGEFVLKSGIKSPIYIDLRLLVSYPKLLDGIAQAIAEKAKAMQFDRVAGIPYTAIPIATLASQKTSKPMVYTRKEVKEYGTKQKIEGKYEQGETVLVIDDLITNGGSKFEAIAPLEEAGLKVKDIIVVVDRQQGGKETVEAKGYKLHALVGIKQVLEVLVEKGKITKEKQEETIKFLEENKPK
ncbi:orotate phosphoribosyltransferase [Candidatus Micrarchaeota archaeon]|nr:orotate phosphoribosyltransferase [Candidatus Micrarchaeota archaeon]